MEIGIGMIAFWLGCIILGLTFGFFIGNLITKNKHVCPHVWIEYEPKVQITTAWREVFWVFTLKCEKCGEIKVRKHNIN